MLDQGQTPHLTQSCPMGYTVADVEPLGDKLWRFMQGQTVALCDGRKYNHATKQYEPTECAGRHHGIVIYPWDVDRYIKGLPVID